MKDKKVIGILSDFVEKDECDKYKRKSYRTRANYIEAINKNKDIAIVLLPYDLNSIEFYSNLCHGVLLVGGDDINPTLYKEEIRYNNLTVNNTRFNFEIEFLKHYIILNKPILGICAGMQSINVALGGSLYQDIKQDTESYIEHCQNEQLSIATHNILISRESLLYKILGVDIARINSCHHQSIKKLGEGLITTAKSEDGIIEAIEMKEAKFCIGVQWHPEFLSSDIDKKILDKFVDRILCN